MTPINPRTPFGFPRGLMTFLTLVPSNEPLSLCPLISPLKYLVPTNSTRLTAQLHLNEFDMLILQVTDWAIQSPLMGPPRQENSFFKEECAFRALAVYRDRWVHGTRCWHSRVHSGLCLLSLSINPPFNSHLQFMVFADCILTLDPETLIDSFE